jgi:hypothetical protein
MTDEDHQELGAWRLAAKLTGAINEPATTRKTTPEDVLRLIKFLRDQLAEAQHYVSEGGFAKGERDVLRRELENALASSRAHAAKIAELRTECGQHAMKGMDMIDRLIVAEAGRDSAEQALTDSTIAEMRMRDELRIAESMRDDARAASARDLAARRDALEVGKIVGSAEESSRCRATHPMSPDASYLDGWKKGVLDAIDKLWAAHASSVLINNDKIFELLNILLQHPPTGAP